jgi:predicted aldo/keto reductase-like oxidoreductase
MGTFNRRNFLFKTTGLAASASLLGMAAYANKPENLKYISGDDVKFITRTLGRTGITLPIVSMGVMNANNPGLLKEAYKRGIRHFDTAWYYQNGNNERMIGSILKELGVNRSDVVIATKIFLLDILGNKLSDKELKAVFLKRFTESLERLKMDYVDILYYHNILNVEMMNAPFIKEAFEELKQKKLIRHSGISVHVDWPDILNTAANDGFYDVALLSYNYSMDGQQQHIDALKNAASKGMGLIAMKTQCQQGWYKQELPAEMQKFYEGTIMHSALLKWVMHHDYFATAIPGFTTYQQLEEDIVVASNLGYNDNEKKFIEDHNVKLALQGTCQICGKCTGTCPQGANIPDLMRTHMYAFSYGNVQKANETIRAIETGSGIDTCSKCNICVAQCVRKVNIGNRISELKEIYC